MPKSRVLNDPHAFEDSRPHDALRGLALVLLWCGLQAVRLPLLGLLWVLAPFVRILLGGFAMIGTFTAFLFEFGGARPFPFFGTLAVSLGALAVLWLYETLLQLLSGADR